MCHCQLMSLQEYPRPRLYAWNHGGGAGTGPFTPTPPPLPPPPPWKLTGKCHTMGAKGALSKFCLT